MKKSIYIFICLLFSINFWNLSFISSILKPDISLVFSIFLGLLGLFLYPKPNNFVKLGVYNSLFYVIIFGVFVSMFSAYFNWGQSIKITFVAQRWMYNFIMLPILLYIVPTEKDIIDSLKWITIGTIGVWCLSIVAPQFISSIGEEAIEYSSENSDIGFYVAGIRYVVLYFYFLVQSYIDKFSLKNYLKATGLFLFIFLYQNRSLLMVAILVYCYSFFRFKSKYKVLIFISQIVLLIVAAIYTQDIWLELINESQDQLQDQDYNRWKALAYYIYEYSPNWFCYVFGNGMPSGGNSELGNLYWSNMERGIFASDLGMIGMWTIYGTLPLIAIYYVLVKGLFKKQIPLYYKFMAFHVILIPTIFQFKINPGIFFFVLLIYLYAFNIEKNRINKLLCLQ